MRIFLALIFIFCSAKLWALDLSKYYELSKVRGFTSAEIKKLKNYRILIVPGVLAESISNNSKNKIKDGFIFEDGFKQHKKLMEDYQIDFRFIDLETESSPESNGKLIALEIERSPKPVIIYSHSKGGLDTLEALRLRPDLIGKIKGWVTIQTPFMGSTIASLMYDHKILQEGGEKIFEWLGGEASGMSSLTTDVRSGIMNQNETMALLERISAEITFINYASFKADSFGVDSPLELFRNFMLTKEGANDGVVGLKSALLKEQGYQVDFVIETDVDHLMTMAKYRPDKMDFLNWRRNRFSQRDHMVGILKLLLKKAN